MFDIETMRLMLGAVSLMVLVLFYLGVYRPTRSAFAGWWTLALLCSGLSSTFLLMNGTIVQGLANPASSVASAVGVTCTWFATRSLRRSTVPIWVLPAGAALVLALAALGDPAENIWAGDGILFIYMAAMLGAAATEVWATWHEHRRELGSGGEARVALLVSALAATVLCGFYVERAALFLAVGPESALFQTLAGTGATSAILLLCLVAVTFSASALGWDQRTHDLRRRAISDDLTGLLGRSEFLAWAETAVTDSPAGVSLVVADLDHFKQINDVHGHAAGDLALREFADVLREAVGVGEFAGRLGGEEFALLLRDAPERASERLDDLAAAFAARAASFETPLPTVSFGVAAGEHGETLTDVFEHADKAMYQAKADGRDRVVAYTPEPT
ncbi:diguanylate cyclase [uncultured Demequina sp.]|uniref:GGDEF domain-containing protein n=1 Tax=uncultured Demequina sp. TaxID=693499 RepID=UPI0025D82186|nr:GGDEF domain-containing protein [uncultured Demequina sp.]